MQTTRLLQSSLQHWEHTWMISTALQWEIVYILPSSAAMKLA